MKDTSFAVQNCALFEGIQPADIPTLLRCLSEREQGYERGAFIFSADDRVTSIGIVLSGVAHVVREDYWGNRTILMPIGPGELFGEAFSCAKIERLPVSVVAAEKCEVLLLNYKKIITTCSPACVFHTALIENMLKILAEKNIRLMQKIGHISKRTTREKLLSYLSEQAMKGKSNTFEIPFNRQELAEYLAVDRSAMSSELSKMQSEGILTFHRNRFELMRRGRT